MIISDYLKRYLQLLHSKADQGDVYWIEDPVIKRYEIIREYAQAKYSSKKLGELSMRYNISTKTIKSHLEAKRKGGTLALFIEPLITSCNLICSELEKKIVILYRGGDNSAEILGTLGSIDPTLKNRGLSGRHIKLVLRSHGLLPIEGLEDINFQILQSLLSSFTKVTKRRNGRIPEEFFDQKDQIQCRLEMLRSVYHPLIGKDKLSAEVAAKKCNLSKTHFFNIKKLFDSFGVLGLLNMTRGRVSKHKLTAEIESKIVHQKLSHPNMNSKDLLSWAQEEFDLKLARISIDNMLSFWFGPARLANIKLYQSGILQSGHKIPHVSSAEAISLTTGPPAQEGKEPISHLYGLSFPAPQVEMLFADIMEWLGLGNGIEISRPGLFIMAPYLRKLGIYECFETLVRKGSVSRTAFYAFILNINRILGGLCTINRLQFETDLSMPLASGLGAMLSPNTIHKGLEELSAELIHSLKLDVARNARKLGLVNGAKSAFDFHFIIFYGDDADVKGFSKGPTKKGICLPGHRPHIWWDLGTNTIGFIYYCEGRERAPKTVLPFLHSCVFEIIDQQMLKEVFMDSEYTSFDIFSYLGDSEGLNLDVTMCMRSNALHKFIAEKIEDGPWLPWGEKAEYEITSGRVTLEDIGRKVHLVLKRKVGKSTFRIFVTTREGLTDEDLLDEYRDRWGIETGIKELVYSYFLDQVPSNSDPVKIDAHFYCVMVAKLAVDLFIKEIGGFIANDRNTSKRTLHSLRDIFFVGKTTRLTREIDELVLTYHDGIQEKAWDLFLQLQERQSIDPLSIATPWWGGMRPVVRHESQLPDNLKGPLKSVKFVSPDFLARDLVQKFNDLKR